MKFQPLRGLHQVHLKIITEQLGCSHELRSKKKTDYRTGTYSSVYRFTAARLDIVRTSGKGCIVCDFVSNEYNVKLSNCNLLLLDDTRQMSNNPPSFHDFHCIRSVSIASFARALKCFTSYRSPIILVHMIAPNTRTKLGFRYSSTSCHASFLI